MNKIIESTVIIPKSPRRVPSKGGMYAGKVEGGLLAELEGMAVEVVEVGLVGVYDQRGVTVPVYASVLLNRAWRPSSLQPPSGAFLVAPPVLLLMRENCQQSKKRDKPLNVVLEPTFPRFVI